MRAIFIRKHSGHMLSTQNTYHRAPPFHQLTYTLSYYPNQTSSNAILTALEMFLDSVKIAFARMGLGYMCGEKCPPSEVFRSLKLSHRMERNVEVAQIQNLRREQTETLT